MSKSLRVCYLSAEVAPYAKVGGLADVAGSLPKALRALGHEIILVLPKYSMVEEPGLPFQDAEVESVTVSLASETVTLGVQRGTLPGSDVPIYFLMNEQLFGGGVYIDSASGNPYANNAKRFAVYSLGSLELLRALGWRPDVIHLNDNHVGLVPLYLAHRYGGDPVLGGVATAITIHNLAYQGAYPAEEFETLDLPPELVQPGSSLVAGDQINFLKAGLLESDVINTVSETYAGEIQTEEYGAGLDGILRERREVLFGILNGADYSIWDPRVDSLIPHRYNPEQMEGKRKNKAVLLEKMGLPAPGGRDVPVIGMISRLVEQKGFDILEPALLALLEMDLQMVVLGTGEKRYEDFFAERAGRHPDRMAVQLVFGNALAHLIEAGSDMFLMPSRFEPSGLNQIYSLRYGTVPIVRATGGLADTVRDNGGPDGTGYVFQAYEPGALIEAVRRAIDCYRDRAGWAGLVSRGMALDFSWGVSAQKYADLYHRAIELAQRRTQSSRS